MTELDRVGASIASSDPEERRLGASLLVSVDPETAAGSLTLLLGDEDWRVRKEAVASAAALAPAPAVLRALVDALQPSDNVGLRNAAVEALAAFGVDAVDALAAAIPALDADGRKLAAEALARCGQSNALTVLQKLIHDEDTNVCVAAVEAVAVLGVTGAVEVVDVLSSCLDSPEELVRLAALAGLGELGVALSWERLTRLPAVGAFGHAVLAVAGRTGDERAAAPLVRALPRSRGGTLLERLRSLVELARSGPGPRAALKSAARELDLGTRKRLLVLAQVSEDMDTRALGLLATGALAIDDAAHGLLLALSDEVLEGVAEEGLDWLGSPAVKPLLERAHNAEGIERAACIDIAARLAEGADVAAVRAEALAGLNDAAPEVVRASFGALGVVGDASCLDAVAARLVEDGGGALRRAAESSLAVLAARFSPSARKLVQRVPPASPEAHAAAVVIRVLGPPVRGSLSEDVEFLVAAQNSAAAQVRRAALESLGAVGGELAVEPIALALTDEEREVRLAAVRALGRLRSADGDVLGLATLVQLSQSGSDEEMAVAAVLALGETGDTRALPILRPLVRSGDPKAAVAAVEALGAFPEARRLDAMIDGLAHPATEVVKAALRALGEGQDGRALLHLGAALDHEAWDVRRLAADLLGRYGNPAAGPLRARLAVEDDALVREAIGRALDLVVGRRSFLPARGSLRPR
jgi:HEAT repeat protein